MDESASTLKLLPLGDTAWTVEFGNHIDPALYARVLGLLDALKDANLTDRKSVV